MTFAAAEAIARPVPGVSGLLVFDGTVLGVVSEAEISHAGLECFELGC